jgi:UDP-N-acetylmuramyl pentapeptide synthase
MRKETRAKVTSFGFHADAELRASDLLMGHQLPDPTSPTLGGIHFKLHAQGSVIPVDLPGVLGAHQVLPALIAAAVGLHMGMHLVEIADALKSYQSPPGRMRLIPGIKQTLIIDDSYNASPAAVAAALETLAQFEMAGRTIVALGNMAELGKGSETAHAEVGRMVVDVADMLVTVGDLGKEIARSAERAGMSRDVIFTFDQSTEAGRFLQDRIQPLDVLFVKGSQSMRMEKIVKELMAEPLRARELLVRQEPTWLK